MKNWITKLLTVQVIIILCCLIVTYILTYVLHVSWWSQLYSMMLSLALSFVISFFLFDRFSWGVAGTMVVGLTLNTLPIVTTHWLLFSADEIVTYHSIEDLYNPQNDAVYFTFPELIYDQSGVGKIQITHNLKSGRHRQNTIQKRYIYGALPLFSDSAKTKVKAWITDRLELSNGNFRKELFHPDSILCFERNLDDRADFAQAIANSKYKDIHPQAINIRPLYKAFTSQTEWKGIFLKTVSVIFSVLIFFGILINKLDKTRS